MEKSIITLNVDFDKVALEDVKSLCEMISKALPDEVVAVLPQGVYLTRMTIDEVIQYNNFLANLIEKFTMTTAAEIGENQIGDAAKDNEQ